MPSEEALAHKADAILEGGGEEAMKIFVKNDAFSRELDEQPDAFKCVSQCRLDLFDKQQDNDGAWPDKQSGRTAAIESACAAVFQLYSNVFDDASDFVDLVLKHNLVNSLAVSKLKPFFDPVPLTRELLLALRTQLVFHLLSNCQTMLVKQGPIRTKVELFEQMVKNMIVEMLEMFSVSKTAVRENLPKTFMKVRQERPDESFTQMMLNFMAEAQSTVAFCEANDGTSFNIKRDALRSELALSASVKEAFWTPILLKAGLTLEDVKLDFTALQLFPGVKKPQCIQSVITCYDEKFSEAAAAWNILKSPSAHVLKQFELKYIPVAQGQIAQDLDVARAVDDDNASVAKALPVGEFMLKVVNDEKNNEHDEAAMTKELVSKMLVHFMDTMRNFVANSQSSASDYNAMNIEVVIGYGGANEDEAGKDIFHLRRRPGIPCKLPIFGKVVESLAASRCPRGTLYDLGDSGGKKQLYLDASGHVNKERSDLCMGALVGPCPKPKPETPIKAKKKTGKGAAPASAKVPTHMIITEPFNLTLSCGAQFTYGQPFLVDNPEHVADVNQSTLLRKRTALDDADMSVMPTMKRVRKSFAMS